MTLVVCETVHAIVTHLREPTEESPVRFGGFSDRTSRPFPVLALCGSQVAWDTQLPVSIARCRDCNKIAAADAAAKEGAK